MKNKKLKIGLVPGYLIVLLFCLFIFIMIGWIVLASLSTTPEIFKGQMLKFKTGLHFENYLNALISNNIGLASDESMDAIISEDLEEDEIKPTEVSKDVNLTIDKDTKIKIGRAHV